MTIAYDSSAEVVGTSNPLNVNLVPAGTLRGVVVAIIQDATVSDIVTGVTCGGVAMDRLATISNAAAPEPGRVYFYLLGSSVPAGTLAISVSRSEATTVLEVVPIGLTAAGDLEMIDSDSYLVAGSDPSLTLQYGGRVGYTLAALLTGVGAPSLVVEAGSGMTRVQDHDFGGTSGLASRQTTAGSADFTVAYTANPADTCLLAVALAEAEDAVVAPPPIPTTGGTNAFRSPAWLQAAIQGVKDLKGLITLLAAELPRFAQTVLHYERVAVLPYAATVRPSGNLTRVVTVNITNTSAWAMANPTIPKEGVELTFDIRNGSGGTMGAVTWGTEYELAGAFVKPVNGKHRLISFIRMPDGTWRESRRSNTDLD